MHALAHLFGFELLTRIRNWKDLVFYRPAVDARYAHIDSLFGPPGENTINWRLIETHWVDLMQVSRSRSAQGGSPQRCCCAGSGPSRARTTSTRRSGNSAG